MVRLQENAVRIETKDEPLPRIPHDKLWPIKDCQKAITRIKNLMKKRDTEADKREKERVRLVKEQQKKDAQKKKDNAAAEFNKEKDRLAEEDRVKVKERLLKLRGSVATASSKRSRTSRSPSGFLGEGHTPARSGSVTPTASGTCIK